MSSGTNKLSETWLLQFKANGYKLTGPRYSVVEILADTDKALTALEIYDQAHRQYPSIGLVSVYRTLEKLEQLGLIQRVHQKEKCQAYIAAPQGHEHLLVCHSCGRVSFFRGDNLKTLVNVVEEKTGYVIQEHWLQLVGICKECQHTHDK
jgi:Fur family transcriptional regulator, ferric uptake regulator